MLRSGGLPRRGGGLRGRDGIGRRRGTYPGDTPPVRQTPAHLVSQGARRALVFRIWRRCRGTGRYSRMASRTGSGIAGQFLVSRLIVTQSAILVFARAYFGAPSGLSLLWM